ncbi:MAG: 4-hydroxy-tetrahydrodipicolinate synthase [Oscillospiraceae bacterium]|nr:4-hydroxy-tetrahydrodipicolinate synthase [Oscillospiraceae bacterium]
MNVRNIRGSIVALVTPFNADGSVNFEALGRLIDFHLENKTDAILVLGTTGESATMTHEEDDEVCRFTVDRVAGRVPVIAGSGSNCTQTMLEKSLSFQSMGVDGLLLISPYYNKANEEGMYHHFKTVADAVNIPCILYNVPGRTGCSISENVVRRLSTHPNIMGIKEASGNMSYAAKIARYISDDFRMYSGNDDIIIPMMALGSSGVISVLANVIPLETHNMVWDYINGDHQKALDAQLKYLELTNNLFIEVNPIPVKTALNLMNMNAGSFRLPLYEMSPANQEKLAASMRGVGLL